jgi:hypothetical protein
MKHYTPKQINQIKQEIRTGKPVAIIADELAKEWKRPIAGVYGKVLRLSKQTRKIVNTYEGPTKRPYVRKKALRPAVVQESIEMDFQPMPGSLWDNFDKRVEEIAADIEASKIPIYRQRIVDLCIAIDKAKMLTQEIKDQFKFKKMRGTEKIVRHSFDILDGSPHLDREALFTRKN